MGDCGLGEAHGEWCGGEVLGEAHGIILEDYWCRARTRGSVRRWRARTRGDMSGERGMRTSESGEPWNTSMKRITPQISK